MERSMACHRYHYLNILRRILRKLRKIEMIRSTELKLQSDTNATVQAASMTEESLAMEQICLACGSDMFETVLLDEHGHIAMDKSFPLSLESDEIDDYFKYPSCTAKNVVHHSTSPHGLPQIRISHVKA
jgi:hypothetical protein